MFQNIKFQILRSIRRIQRACMILNLLRSYYFEYVACAWFCNSLHFLFLCFLCSPYECVVLLSLYYFTIISSLLFRNHCVCTVSNWVYLYYFDFSANVLLLIYCIHMILNLLNMCYFKFTTSLWFVFNTCVITLNLLSHYDLY